ncbi:MAG: CxxxxCH/CxxCH domain-containing protein [Desulfuromonadales bacterium]|nr:CxxxxCH/CxxCH domain-containing protein [Desulfuromonadales bacterium]
MRAKVCFVLLSLAVVLLILPSMAMAARAVHNFNCSLCHKVGATLYDLNSVVCLDCHSESATGVTILETGQPTTPDGTFASGDASNAFGNNPLPADAVSHNWAASTNNQAAGAQEPSQLSYPGFFKRYNPTRGKVACSRCHEIHGDLASNPKLLRLSDRYAVSPPLTADQMCRACHVAFNTGPGNNGLLTHPMLNAAELDAVETDPVKNVNYKNMSATLPAYDPAASFASPVNLVEGGVGCVSCHSVHFADSDASTVDGPLQTLSAGDGHLLRSDGPRDLGTVIEADFTLVEAQKRSTLCQQCHTHKLHGKVDDGAADRFLGCLDCHSGHVYNGSDPYYFILRKDAYNPITDAPVTFNGYTFGAKTYRYSSPDIFTLVNRTEVWKDNSNLTANGYCEACHGEAETIPKGALTHSSTDDCAACHLHNGSGWTYSFENDASAETCGDCHGFPPYVDARGDRTNGGIDGGFAYMSTAWSYDSPNVTYYKDESLTPHNAHAAGGTAQGAVSDYIFGNGVYACEPCHENYVPTHQEEGTTPYATGFRDVNFYPGIDKASTASYNATTGQCSSLYCHSNGAPRSADGPTRNYANGTVTTPAWENGKNQIIGQPGRCGSCHGNTSASMTSRGNSPAHNKHLDQYGNDCSICHSLTAVSNAALASGANLVNILSPAAEGKHVNTEYDVVYKTSGSLLYSAMAVNSVGVDYDPVTGTCSVYCHDPADLGTTADWDDGVGGAACGSCHGVTAATLTTNSHAVHIDPAGANVSCDDCHGTGANTATHSGHVDGVPTTLAVSTSCDVCHGVENSAAWDVSPIWGTPASVDCRTCHIGAVVTSYNAGAVIAPDKSLASSIGHNLTGGNYAVTGNPAANMDCTACHLSSINGEADHVGGVAAKLLLGGFSCEACHTSGGSRNAEATVNVQTHSNMDADYTGQKRADFSVQCLACHDPHGAGSNIAMVAEVKTDFAGTVVFTNTTGADSFDELDADNVDDICATCHTTTVHNNLAVAGTHKEGDNCLTCHGHTEANAYGGFMPQGGTACNDCHGNPPTASDDRPAGKAGVHEMHVNVSSHEESEDKFDCEVCHPGASTFTLSHADSLVSLAPGVTNGTCASACHYSGVDDGSWNDSDGLNCDSCHYWSASPTGAGNIANGNSEALSLTHNKHFDSGKACTVCHPDNSTDTAFPRTHIDDHDAWDLNAINDGTVLIDRGGALQDEATINVVTWDDGTDTCSNAACHNPSGLSNAATWGTPNSQNCDFCHSGSNPDSGKGVPGSHGAHMAANGTFGLNVNCASCHPDNSGDNGHLTGVVELNGFTYSASLSDYGDTTYGRCTTTVCHNDGKGSAVQTPVWGAVSANCSICHTLPPNTGRHSGHVDNTSYVANCGVCHLGTTSLSAAVATHIDDSVQAGDATIDLVSTNGVTCTNACHDVDATGTWTDSNPLACTECHSVGKIGTAPISGLHSGSLTISDNTHGLSFQVTRDEAVPSGSCTTCHTGIDVGNNLPAAHIAGGAPTAAQAALSADINYSNGAPSTCAPVNGLASCHDDGGAWNRKWSTTAKNSDDTECANCHGDFDRGWVTGVIARHAGDAQVEAGHDGVDKCYMCHTYKKGVTEPYDFSVKHRDGTIQLNDDMLFVDNNDSTNTCNGCHDSGGTGPYGTADGEYGFIDTNKDDTADGGADRWSREMVVGGPAGNCNGCHETYGRDHTGVNESAAVHTYHTGSPMSPGCGACHPTDSGPGGLLHEDGTVDFGGTYLTTALNYTGDDFTNTNCSTANGCHDSDEGSWVADSLATCADCHAATGKLLDQGGYPPTSNAHGAHLANAAYVGTVDVDACDACHGVTSSVVNHLSTHNDGKVTVINDITAYTLIGDAGDGTCTNNCHTVVSGRDWNDATTLACSDCHLNAGDIGKENKNHLSGLHQASSALAHNESFGAGGTCTSCHTGINLSTPATHVDGNTTDPNTTFGLFAGYNTGASTCMAACHDDGGDWTRRWNTAVDAKPLYTDAGTAAVCGNCHGGFAQGWNDLSSSHINPDADNDPTDGMPSHNICSSCHGWGDTGYAGNTKHQNSAVTMNLDLGYDDPSGTCSTNCHSGMTLSVDTNSGFPVDGGSYGGVGCGGCHNDGGIPPTSGAHIAHGANGDSNYSECEACHGTSNGGAWADGSGGAHNDGNVTFAAGISYSNNGTPGTGAAANDDTCATTICHSGVGNEAVWGTPASVGCDACHYYSATPTVLGNSSDANPLSATHEAHFTKGKVCTACHTDNTSQTVYPNRTHINFATTLVDKANATMDEAAVLAAVLGSGSDPDPGNATCGGAGIGLGCHNTKTTPAWGSSATCASCHTAGGAAPADPVSGLHAVTPTISSATHDGTLAGGNCINCHDVTAPSNLHQDGTLQDSSGATFTFHSNVTGYSAAGCAATCHADNGDWARQWSTTAANSDGSECANCHGGIGAGYAAAAWVSGIVPDHLNNWDGDGNGPEVMTSHSVCKSCHGFNGAADKDDNYLLSMHRNNQITMNGGTNYNQTNFGCDSAGCHGDYADGHALADSGWTVELGAFDAGGDCWTCHGNGSNQSWPDGTTYPDRAGVHLEHVKEIAAKMAGGDTTANRNATCGYCHPGGVHSGDQGSAPADVSNTDSDNDGVADLNTFDKMKKIIGGGEDSAGIWRSTPGTCSSVACHASAPYTPHWYTDTVPPANVTLTASAGPVPRSIKLSWTAPGDDGNLDGTAYKYDIRWGTSQATAEDFALTSNHVKGVPTVERQGASQEAIIHGVDTDTTYYFALRTYDENVIADPATTLYGASNTVNYTTGGVIDTVAPILTGSPQWYGIDRARTLDTSGTVQLSWTRAEDHSMPITYDIWWSEGLIDFDGTSPQVSTRDTRYRVTGLTDGNTYNFGVRARDAAGNIDSNTVTMQAIPQGLASVPKTGKTYYANGMAASNIPMQTTVHTTDGTTSIYPATFIASEAFGKDTTISANSFSINVDNANAISTLSAELGYITGTNTWNPFAERLFATEQSVAKRAVRTVTFKFNGEERLLEGSWNARLGVKVSVVSGGIDLLAWGPTTKGGILAVAAQPVNASPTVPSVSAAVNGAEVDIWWTPSTDTDDDVADTVHYDVYGSANGGADGFPHVIASGLPGNATSGAPLVWDTQAAGIALDGSVNNVQIKVEAGDVINGKVLSHSVSTPVTVTVNNSGDNVAPGEILHFQAETRPKQGSVYLSWMAPGDDGDNNGRALFYDIRWSTQPIVEESDYIAANQVDSEPYPDFGGYGQGYEALGLTAGNYYFAIKAYDEGNNASPMATTATFAEAGPKCGICHSTPPDETATRGNHAKHGYTMRECANCHGSEAAHFTPAHQDGDIKLGWKTDVPVVAEPYLAGYRYLQNGLEIYVDSDGSGGFNPAGDNMDDGSCFNWSSQNVSGCHGPASAVQWDVGATLGCSDCHGDGSRILDDYSHSFDDGSDDVKAAPPVDNHGYDGSGATVAERKYVGAHVAHLNYSFRLSKGDSCRLCHGPSRPGNSLHADGYIDVELDLSAAGDDAVWTPGDETDPNPANWTAGTCGSMSPDACHPSTATPSWDSNEKFECTNCHGFGGTTPTHVTDPDSGLLNPDNADASDPMPGNCTWCHVGGHPKEKKVISITNGSPALVTTENAHNMVGGEKVTIHTQTGMTEINNRTYSVTITGANTFTLDGCDATGYGVFDYGTWIEGNGTGIILVPNDSRVGIAYQSGGIHLKANIADRGEAGSEAELCWGCHTPNGISEWGADDGLANVYTREGFTNNNYNYGTLTATPNGLGNWIGATWTSGTTGAYGFGYKTGTIRSTHSTDPTGTSALTGSDYAYTDGGVDAVNKIRCSNCHDVHNTNKSPLAADGLDPGGPPYLRGTWKSNPYKEDGAPQSGQSYSVQGTLGQPGYGYGQVPRANPSPDNAMGGFWIDQNSGSPTAGWTYESSAGLCQLCHSKTVDTLDQLTGENLWIGTGNGHANSVLDGTGTGAANIFRTTITNNVGRQGSGGAAANPNPGAWMGFQESLATLVKGVADYAYGPRSGRESYLTPYAAGSVTVTKLEFAWGNSVDAATVEKGYHLFSCSKCHNPHASRLPKLMITNCLDVRHNTWDNDYTTNTNWTSFNSTSSSWGTNKLSHLSTAQNCHRYIDLNNDNTPDESGWNKVTPW